MKNFLSNISPKILAFLRNKYTLIISVFLIWIIFFDTNSVLVHYKLSKENQKLDNKINYYSEKFEKDSVAYYNLRNSKEEKQKYAREKYFMKKSDEDIFIVVHASDSIE